jgi:hypothetical protein
MRVLAIGSFVKHALARTAPVPVRLHLPSTMRLRARSGPPPTRADAEQRFVVALEAYARCDWHHAYAALGALADEGHVHAVRLALQIARHGDRLFGGHFRLSEARSRRWVAVLMGARLQPEPRSGD